MSILWEFARELKTAATPGNTTSYLDELSQSFYISGGKIKTQIGQVENGQWGDLSREPEIEISEAGYSKLDIEHNYNGAVFGTAEKNGDVIFLMYEYMLDVSQWFLTGTWQMQPDNPIKAGQVEIANADMRRFSDDAYTLFSPGSRFRLRFSAGDSELYEIGTFYIETSPYNELESSFVFNGRNSVGYLLARQTFDDKKTYSGQTKAMFVEILEDAGVPDNLIVVQDKATNVTFSFKEDDSFLDGMIAATEQVDWFFEDLPDGRIVVGSETFIRDQVSRTGIYYFDKGKDIFSRSVTRSADGAFSRVCIRRGGETPLSLFADVPYFDGWFIGKQQTYYHTVHGNTGQPTMERILEQLVEAMQFTGITEEFSSPFRPYLQVGDVAVITGNDDRIVGIISDLRHSFGVDGFFTTFTVTSGGTISDPENPSTIATRFAGKIGGANRPRRLLDYIKSY